MVDKISNTAIISGILTISWLVIYLVNNFIQIPYSLFIMLLLPIITIILSLISLTLIKKYGLKGKKIALFSLILNIIWVVVFLSQHLFIAGK